MYNDIIKCVYKVLLRNKNDMYMKYINNNYNLPTCYKYMTWSTYFI